MATIGEHFLLCPTFSVKNKVYVTATRDTMCVTVTHKSRFIDIYKIEDQKIIHSWSFKHGTNLNGPVVYNHTDNTYIAMVNKKEIRTWNPDLQSLDKAKKFVASNDVHKVITLPDSEPVVLFENGIVSGLSNVNGLLSQDPGLENSEIVWCDVVTCQNGENVVCYMSKTPEGNYQSHFSRKHGNDWTTNSLNFLNNSKDICCCCIPYANEAHIYILSPDGRVFCVSENDGSARLIQTVSGVIKGATMTTVGESHVAIAGIKKQNQNGIGIFDVNFGSLLSWKPLPEESYYSIQQVFAVGSHLFIPCGNGIYAYEYSCQPCTLASVLGTFRHNEELSKGDNLESISLSWRVGNPQVIEKPNSKILELFSQLNNPTKTATLEEFQPVFNRLMTVLENPDYEEVWTSEHMVNLIRRMTQEKKFWAKHEFLHVINQGHVPPSVIAEFYESLIQHIDLVLLHASLTNLHHVPEAQLVKTLNFYMRCRESDFSEICDETIEDLALESKDDTLDCPFGFAKTLFVNALLAQPYNDVFLLECLQSFPFEFVLTLMQYLYYLFNTCSRIDKPSDNTPSLIQVVDWMCLLIDAHATQLILSPDARPVLVNLHELVKKQMFFYDELISLEAVLSQLQEKCTPLTQRNVGIYCIEVLHIS